MALTFLFVQHAAPQSTDQALESSKVAENTERAGGPATLQGLIKYAMENNPGLKAARLDWARVIQKYPQATYLDDPMLTYTLPVEEIETRLGPQEHVVKLTQKFPFPGKLGLKGEVVFKEIDIARIKYEMAIRDIISEVKKSFYELYYIDKAIELAEENKAVLDYFSEVSKVNYGLDVSELDELVRAQKLSAEASYELIVLRDMRQSAVARLNTLLDRNPSDAIEKLEEPEFNPFSHSLDDMYKSATANHEELRIAGIMLEKSELEERLAKYSYLPDFQIGLNYSSIGEPPLPVEDAGQDAVAFTFGINIPIWFGKNRAAVNEKNIIREKSLIEKNAIVNEIQNAVRSVYFDITGSGRIVKLYGESLIPEAKKSLEFAEARYKNGEERLSRLLETQSMWLNFRRVYYRALADYLKSIAELERLTKIKLY
jgi:outer membrane protein TolC